MQAHLLYHTKMWHGCKVCPFLINLCQLNHCIKYLPRLGDDGLMASTGLTLSDTQLCGIIMRGCKKEWTDQYDTDISGIPTNVDALLEKCKVYEKLDKSNQQSTPIPLKPAVGRGGNHGSNKWSGGGSGDGRLSESFCISPDIAA